MQRIKKAYAENGDLKIIPETPPLDGSENWEQGRGAYFELDNDPNTGDPLALDIDREQDNYFKNVISKNIKHWQENTYPIWFDDIEYPKNATVKYTDGNIYVSKVASNTALPTNATNWTIYDPSSSVHSKSTNITVNVGAGQAYTTINKALEYLSGFYPTYKQSGVIATINLKAGFVMAEQVLVSRIDLGWITIVGEDAETIITHTALTTNFYGNYPAFGVDKGGTSPVIGQLFRFNVEKVGGGKHGLMAFGAGSSANILPGKGFIGAGTHGIFAVVGSIVNAESANCSNAGTYGIFASIGSIVNAESANCSNAGAYGIFASTGSIVNAGSANCSNAGACGINASTGSTINASSANCSNAGTYGINANRTSTINAESANCSNAGTYGIYSSNGSTVTAYTAIIQNQTTGFARVCVADGSHIEATGINTTGGTVPALSQTANTLTGNGIIYQ